MLQGSSKGEEGGLDPGFVLSDRYNTSQEAGTENTVLFDRGSSNEGTV